MKSIMRKLLCKLDSNVFKWHIECFFHLFWLYIYLHYLVDERPDIEPRTGFFQPKGDGLTLIGESGVGKTSMVEQVLSYFPNVIEHELYQVPSLKLQ